MNNIDESIHSLMSVCVRHAIEVEFRHTDMDYPDELPSNKYLKEFYKTNNPVNFTLDMGGSLIELFSLEDLLKKQMGYRWLSPDEGKKIIPTWNLDHVVIADDIGGGKPIIAEIKKDRMPIYASCDGLEPFFITDSLDQFIDALSSITDVINSKYNVYDIYDENEEIKNCFRIDFIETLKSILSMESSKNLFYYFYG